MKFIEIDKNTNEIKSVFGWNDGRQLPTDYPKQDGTTIIGIPENFASDIRLKWQKSNIFIKNTNSIIDSSKDFNDYFTETERGQVEEVDPQQQISDLKAQNAQMLLKLVEGGLM
ncbi:hypothetical protein KM799_02600 [Clostridium tyrobutyricum]|uniref:hypothetical protein n=1 Tax=Clostridium tyrobutyricum TaxID=1519 RepID=UPI001C39295D|nr:hypothetical protein [Clostridium tyrobutyricum]MBV4445300.1 hypothetical protein [Clostridium tyrobutyricum]MBV4445495.1 hypothetical protein [Clostridium tyrobutyricum]